MRRTTKDLSEEQLYNRLGWKYKAEVERKKGEFVKTDNLRTQLSNISRLLMDGRRWGLFIRGVVGNGKTTAVNALMHTINSLTKEEYFRGEVFDWDWMKVLNARDMINIFVNDNERFQNMKRNTWLVIDDLGQDPVQVMVYGTFFYPFLELIDYRYEHRLPTVIVSNLKEKELKERYNDPRFSDRFNEMFNATTFRDKSFRV